jgi:hypothetical protein
VEYSLWSLSRDRRFEQRANPRTVDVAWLLDPDVPGALASSSQQPEWVGQLRALREHKVGVGLVQRDATDQPFIGPVEAIKRELFLFWCGTSTALGTVAL